MESYLRNGSTFALLFLIIISFALWLAWPLDITQPGVVPGSTHIQEFKEFDNPEDTGNTVMLIVSLIVFTGIILLGFKFGFGRFIKYFFAFVIWVTLIITFGAMLSRMGELGTNPVLDYGLFALAILLTGIVTFRPNLIVTNVVGFIIAAGIAAIMGISIGVIPAIALLVAFAIYDAIAVYKTKHMIALAQGTVDNKIPVTIFTNVHIEPGTDVSKRKEKGGAGGAGFMIGLGDFAIPAVLVVSANVFLRDNLLFGLAIPALGAIIGAVIGYFALSYISSRWKQAHAGLPPLNTAVILGFLIACLIVGEFSWLPF